MPNRKTLICALIVFILSFAITFILIKNFRNDKNQETIEEVQIKD